MDISSELLLPAEPNYISLISQSLTLRPSQVDAVLTLTNEGSTVPFIARYRQERTGWLDEKQIREIIELQKTEENLYKSKVTALIGIHEQGKLTPEIQSNIEKAKTQREVEDIYAPYRQKKKQRRWLLSKNDFSLLLIWLKKILHLRFHLKSLLFFLGKKLSSEPSVLLLLK